MNALISIDGLKALWNGKELGHEIYPGAVLQKQFTKLAGFLPFYLFKTNTLPEIPRSFEIKIEIYTDYTTRV